MRQSKVPVAIVPYFLVKVRETEFYNQITDSQLKDNRDTLIFCQIVDSGESGAGRIHEGTK